jgi:hypothetical protein
MNPLWMAEGVSARKPSHAQVWLSKHLARVNPLELNQLSTV